MIDAGRVPESAPSIFSLTSVVKSFPQSSLKKVLKDPSCVA